MLIDGRWSDRDQEIKDGAYQRSKSVYEQPISHDLLEALTDQPRRFTLIASHSCPWSHRTLLVRALKRLEQVLPIHIAHGPRDQGYRVGTAEQPWRLPGSNRDIEHLHQIYSASDAHYTGRSTVPVLWDSAQQLIVSNESTKIIHALDQAHAKDDTSLPAWTLRPAHLQQDIDILSAKLQSSLSNGVYRAGMAQRQSAYEDAVRDVFKTLDELEQRLAKSRYLHGAVITQSDIRLWPTLARFDCVYHGHFKCSVRRLTDYPNLWGYARDLYGWHGFAKTFNERAIRAAYYGEDREINPFGIIAAAPDIDWSARHQRGRLGPAQLSLLNGAFARIAPETLRAIN